jgi:prephenate dehydrogenase
MTRIASSHFDMWRDIYATNAVEAKKTLGHFVDTLQKSGELIGQDDLAELFDSAAETRAKIPSDSKGFLHPLREILVVIEDKPGVIAEISTTLADHEINILDIEVLKVREGEGGTLRLAFASLKKAENAISLLAAQGYGVRLRK